LDYTGLIPALSLLIGGLLIFVLPLSRLKTLILSTGLIILIGASLFGIPKQELFAQNYAWDGLSLYFSLLILFSVLMAAFLGYKGELSEKITYRKFVFLLFALAALLILLAGSQNLLYFLVLWSMVQILFSLLLKEFDPKLSWNHLVLDLVSSTVFLVGAGLLYAISGALNLIDIKTNLVVRFFTLAAPGKILTVSLVLITIGLMSKLGAFPFHFWLGNFNRQKNHLPYAIGSLLIRLGLLAFAIRFWLRGVIIYLGDWQYILFLGGSVSILWGGLALLIYREQKRTWLYLDSIQLGFLLSGVAAASFQTLSGGLFFLWTYLFGFWGLILTFAYYPQPGFDFKLLFSQLKTNKALAISLIFLVGSVIGFPITGGFWGKYNLLNALLKEKMWGLAIPGVAGTLLLLIYFGLIFRYKPSVQPTEISQTNSWPLRAGIFICVLALVTVGLFPELILKFVLDAAASIPF
jgi:NADH:ubiquinone oxidoreductase subunit 2 (subunit N)